MSYSIVPLEQGTPAWLAWRRSGFGGTDIPIIMGDNAFTTYAQMIADKHSGATAPVTAAMQRGTELEPTARRAYIARTQTAVRPVCVQHDQYRWARASLDGLSLDGSRVVEIKCGGSAYKHAEQGVIPSYYIGQLQHALFVTGLDDVDYWAFHEQKGGILLRCHRDNAYIARIIAMCEQRLPDLPRAIGG